MTQALLCFQAFLAFISNHFVQQGKRQGQRAEEGQALIVAWGDFMPGLEGMHITAGEAGKRCPAVQASENGHQALRITQPSLQSANSKAILCLT